MNKETLLKVLHRIRDEAGGPGNEHNVVFDLDNLIDQIKEDGLISAEPIHI